MAHVGVLVARLSLVLAHLMAWRVGMGVAWNHVECPRGVTVSATARASSDGRVGGRRRVSTSCKQGILLLNKLVEEKCIVLFIDGSEPMQNDEAYFFSDIFLKFCNIIKIII